MTGDGRFTVEQASGGWMALDAEQVNELGLPLVRGPFGTLDAARAAIDDARRGPAPISTLTARLASKPKRQTRPAKPAPAPAPPPVAVREYRTGDGEPLRRLWEEAGFRSLGDDDASLRTFAQRNPGLLLVATRGGAVVGSALGGWDGRRGWIYHVATAPGERRAGLATRLVRQIENRLRSLGCQKVNVIVRDENEAGAGFWEAAGYARHPARQFGRELDS